jgi:hypothetical protein
MMKTIKALLQAGLCAGAVGSLPAVARADGAAQPSSAASVDHATLEARGPGAVMGSGNAADASGRVPDHATAQARGAEQVAAPRVADPNADVPDHATAQAGTPTGPAPR